MLLTEWIARWYSSSSMEQTRRLIIPCECRHVLNKIIHSTLFLYSHVSRFTGPRCCCPWCPTSCWPSPCCSACLASPGSSSSGQSGPQWKRWGAAPCALLRGNNEKTKIRVDHLDHQNFQILLIIWRQFLPALGATSTNLWWESQAHQSWPPAATSWPSSLQRVFQSEVRDSDEDCE